MTRSLIQLGLTDRGALAAARRRAGGEAALVRQIASGALDMLDGASPVILSTCERIEVYAIARAAQAGLIAALVARHLGELPHPVDMHRRVGPGAAAHLFAVATGLESRLIGEPHILGQVAKAPTRTASSALLARLFKSSIACARRVRTTSGLDRLAVSCVDLAIARARAAVRPEERAAVVGSGAIARETALRLVEAGFRVTVFARHAERAAESLLPTVWVAPLDRIPEEMAGIGLLIAATSSATSVIRIQHIANRRKPLLLIDLGVPANIDADVCRHRTASLVTLDDLLEGQRRPSDVLNHARAMTDAAAIRWSRRWLNSGCAGANRSTRRTVA